MKLSEAAAINALSSLIASELVGLAVSQAFRSHGSMLLLDFGELIVPQLPGKLGKPRGQWTLLIEMSYWEINGLPSGRTTHCSPHERIGQTMLSLTKKKVEKVSFDRRGKLILRLQDNISLTVKGQGFPLRQSRLYLWSISSIHHWALALKPANRYIVISDTRIASGRPT
jgi:hypothetical protein